MLNGNRTLSILSYVRSADKNKRRGPLAVQAIPLALLIPLTFFIPETPRWLVSKDRTEEAMQIIRRLHETGDNDVLFKESTRRSSIRSLLSEKCSSLRGPK